MARIRTIKPDFFTSDTVSQLPLRTRLTWIGLWTHCDDHGRCRDNAKLIKAAVWPLDDVSIHDIEIDLNTLADRGLIQRYTVGTKQYLQVTNWDEHQASAYRRGAPKLPGPPVSDDSEPGPNTPEDRGAHAPSRASSTQTRATSTSNRAGTGNREPDTGNREQELSSSETATPTSDAGTDLEPTRDDVERLCAHLADRVEGNGSKRPKVTKRWRDAARLMLDRDGRTEQAVHACIDWSQDDEFWRANVLSMPKLREKYDQMRLKAQGRSSSNGRRSTTDDRVQAGLELAARFEAEESP